MTFLSWPPALLFACVAAIAIAAYWLGYLHGSAIQKLPPAATPVAKHQPEAVAPAPAAAPTVIHHIPPYRVKELTVLMELGVLTPEEFELEKGKLHAGR